MAKADYTNYSTVGSNLRAEADKALQRSILFGFILIMAHLLEIQPSEIDIGGAKFLIKDSSIIYGALALVFGYYLSRTVQQSDLAFAFLPCIAHLLY
jgi:hypothetical protein